MFFTIDMTKEIELHPKFFGPQLRDILKRKLKEEVSHPNWIALVPACACRHEWSWCGG
jgi:hypothetical protein